MTAKSRQRAFTIVELMVVVVIGAVILALATPSLRELIARQRLKSATAELVTDLRYVRTIAMSRHIPIYVKFLKNANMSCYVLYIPSALTNCDCLTRSPGQVCVPGVQAFGAEELRTTQIPASTDVQLLTVPAGGPALVFTTDGLRSSTADYVLQMTRISGGTGQAQVTVNGAGRPSACSPDNSVTGMPQC